jgi:hypothetical protein
MPRKPIEVIALALLLSLIAVAAGQERERPPASPAEKPPGVKMSEPAPRSQLEQLLEQALRDNPDIRVAEAKAREAEAELRRARLLVAQKVTVAHAAVEAARAAVEAAQARYQRLRELFGQKVASAEELRAAEVDLAQAKAALARAEAELPYLIGRQPGEPLRGALLRFDPEMRRRLELDLFGRLGVDDEQLAQALLDAQMRRAWGEALGDRGKGPMADKIRAALDKPVTIDLKEASLTDALVALRKQIPEDVVFQARLEAVQFPRPVPVRLNGVPLGAALQYLEDALEGQARFYVREYGLLLAPSRMVPPGAVPVSEFWKGGRSEEKPAPGGKNPPPQDIEGVVKKADGGLLLISLGSDTGLRVGHTLEVYRLDPRPQQSRYLGQVRVVEVQPTEAVCQQLSPFHGKAEVGDRVAARILGK